MTRILFVDDEPNILQGLRRMLRSCRHQWEMDFCDSGAAALERLAGGRFDVVVSDMRMPGMDGAELLTRVRAAQPETVRIVLSGHSDHEMTLRAVGPAHRYLAKPCDAELLKRTVEAAVRLQNQLRCDRVRKVVSSLDRLPMLPTTYTELVDEVTSPTACVAEAGRIIGSDVGMSAKILQLVNSAFFGLPTRVADVPHAVALLGLGVIRPLVLSTGVFKQFEGLRLGGVSLRKLVNHSLTVGVLARDVVRAEQAAGFAPIDQEATEDAMVAGLLHDVGRLVLAQAFPDDYESAVRSVSDPGEVWEAERDAFGVTHTEVGGYLLDLWGLPADLVEAVAYHHRPSDSRIGSFGPITAVHAAEVQTAGEAVWDTDHLASIGAEDRHDRWFGESATLTLA